MQALLPYIAMRTLDMQLQVKYTSLHNIIALLLYHEATKYESKKSNKMDTCICTKQNYSDSYIWVLYSIDIVGSKLLKIPCHY